MRPTITVMTAVAGDEESHVVQHLSEKPEYAITRRCADVEELLAAAGAGLARVAVVSVTHRAFERYTLQQLKANGVAVVALVDQPYATSTVEDLGIGHWVLANEITHHLIARIRAALKEQTPNATATEKDLKPVSEMGGKVIASWGTSGAPGRSMIALNLAHYLSEVQCLTELQKIGLAGGLAKAMVVDLDTYNSNLAQACGMLSETAGLTLACAAANKGQLDLVSLAKITPSLGPGYRILSGLTNMARWVEVDEASLGKLLQVGRQLAAWSVFDCASYLEKDEFMEASGSGVQRNAATRALLREADVILLTMNAEVSGLHRGLRSLETLRSEELTTLSKVQLVINPTRPGADAKAAHQAFTRLLAERKLDLPVHILSYDAKLQKAQNKNQTIFEFDRKAPLAKAIEELGGAIVSDQVEVWQT